ncbi:ABC transporter ATP-binding protein [Dactylosporangium sp. AC04546]|uniref:ABC transporter ATP-binding protein n=1 Tax=Dactylosporangium sp. AC04546 TaxID=2862460 RepID=UPI001EE0AEAA|nr:ABC transporter ATP-binding protein [Dactylosporangium sp. AC04546]WVK81882.1 ABC transporter ATP-binding protein [Dactylosporangium sp. AC04546]
MDAVALEELSYAYGTVQAVEDVSLRITAGEVVAVLGPNGAGKSTTLLMLLGLLPPRTGSVRLFGRPPAAAVASGQVGAMPQVGGLLPHATVGDLLRFLHDVYPKPMPVAEALELADLTDLVRRPTERLSGGQAQRLRFAMAIIGRPDLLVLDEPTAALDVAARRSFWAAMRGYGRTVLFSTHYLDEADANADRIVVLDRGRVIADGTAAEVKRRVDVRTVSVALAAVDYSVLPGVVAVHRRNDRAVLTTTDADETVLALAAAGLLRDLEVGGADLESAFLALTAREA